MSHDSLYEFLLGRVKSAGQILTNTRFGLTFSQTLPQSQQQMEGGKKQKKKRNSQMRE